MVIRYQLPVYSPLRLGDIARGAAAAFARPDPVTGLAALLRDRYDADEALLCGSGTQALQLALAVAFAEVGSRHVALPAFTCYDVASAAVGAEAVVSLYDTDPASLSPDLKSLEHVLMAGARVVVVCPLYGIPVDWDALEQTALRHGAIVVEDAAQGHGAWWRGMRLGSLAPISTLSFGRGKGWTGGAGGVLLLRGGMQRHTEVVGPLAPVPSIPPGELLRVWMQWAFGRPRTYGVPSCLPWLGLGETRYHDPTSPRRMSRMAALIALHGLVEADREAGIRRTNAAFLALALASHTAMPIKPPDESAAGFLRLPVRLPAQLRTVAASAAARSLGIMRSYPAPLRALSQLLPRVTTQDARYPGAEELARSLVTLPVHSRTTGRDRERVVRLLTGVPARPDAGRAEAALDTAGAGTPPVQGVAHAARPLARKSGG